MIKLLPQEVSQSQVLPKLMEDMIPSPNLPQEEVQLMSKVEDKLLKTGLPDVETMILAKEKDPMDIS